MAMSGYVFIFTLDELRKLSQSTKNELAALDGDFADTLGIELPGGNTPEDPASPAPKKGGRRKKTADGQVILPETNQPNQVSTQFNPATLQTQVVPMAMLPTQTPNIPEMPGLPPMSGMPQPQFTPQPPQQFVANPMPPQPDVPGFQNPLSAFTAPPAPPQVQQAPPATAPPMPTGAASYLMNDVFPHILVNGPQGANSINQILTQGVAQGILAGAHSQYITDANAEQMKPIITAVTGLKFQ